eukprot:TRINITY_DN9509_c0_g4_i1.p1 TRINITY_DN9509_c0_g4~~TRINITY_DN9509_c0_g4_i1.p1  ORF type:complete len:798 (-),score=200.16 TRINITY_DN9509_c0_g4_i1:35-2368(-)
MGPLLCGAPKPHDERGPFAHLASPTQKFLAKRPPTFGEEQIAALEAAGAVEEDEAHEELLALEAGSEDEESDAFEDCSEEDGLEEEESNTWTSYRIDVEKVPDQVLETLWRRACDPKHCTEEVKPLEKVPRLSVTNRTVEQLPPVFDIQHWRQVNTKSKQQRIAREEAEKFPSLREIFEQLFGIPAPPKILLDAAAAAAALSAADAKGCPAQSALAQAHEYHAHFDDENGGAAEGDSAYRADVKNEVALEMIKEAFREGMVQGRPPSRAGAKQRGRRDAFDEGQPWNRMPPVALAVREGEASAQQRQVSSAMHRALEAAREAGTDEDLRVQRLGRLIRATQRVHERCEKKVLRMKNEFTRKKGQMSARLTRRMRRLQLDFGEIQGSKTATILPSVCREGATGRESALHYLKRHRHGTERQRGRQHARYIQQAGRFQESQRLLADPNRVPERGEIYISECFKHVLAAGLIVDDAYFFRCLAPLEAADFESVATVNCVAACCFAFGIDSRKYWSFLKERGMPMFRPRPRPDQVQQWQDWAPWAGVDLEAVVFPESPEVEGHHGAASTRSVDASMTSFQEPHSLSRDRDPLAFGPVLPDNDATGLDRDESNDPLHRVIEQTALDAVLCRYSSEARSGSPRLRATVNLRDEGADDDDGFGAFDVFGATRDQGANSSASAGSTYTASATDRAATTEAPLAPSGSQGPVRPPGAPPPRGARRADPRRLRGTVRSLAQAAEAGGSGASNGAGSGARAGSKARGSTNGAPAMAPITERPRLELLQ